MIEVLTAGLCPTIQDYPGRQGYWKVGLPPSGPMDSLSSRIANKLVGNKKEAAVIEITVMGPTLCFHSDEVIALTGAVFGATLNGSPVPWWKPFFVHSGDELNVGAVTGRGFRCYLAVRGGIEAPKYLGSRSAFVSGGIGGINGKAISKGDRLETASDTETKKIPDCGLKCEVQFPEQWVIGAIPGPHSCPDYILKEYQNTFFGSEFKVNSNSNRMGIRLDGPKPLFARKDGGAGGSHPSNIVDSPYPMGAITLSGDTPIILCADGPSFGGFITFATVPRGEMWKLGQLKLGETVRFEKLSMEEAVRREQRQERILESL